VIPVGGAAAAAARAAAVTSRLNIEVNLRGITDAALRDELAATALMADTVAERAEAIVTAVRAEITG
jgi:formiminotetrahydrofolate cyclodeaminase